MTQAWSGLLPHKGAMMLLGTLERWDETSINCSATSHLDPRNPLSRDGRLAAICGVEYAMQAAALHGALRAGMPQPAGYVASLRAVSLHAVRLDDAATPLMIEARLEQQERFGLLYAFDIRAGGGTLLAGRASIALPRDDR